METYAIYPYADAAWKGLLRREEERPCFLLSPFSCQLDNCSLMWVLMWEWRPIFYCRHLMDRAHEKRGSAFSLSLFSCMVAALFPSRSIWFVSAQLSSPWIECNNFQDASVDVAASVASISSSPSPGLTLCYIFSSADNLLKYGLCSFCLIYSR